MSVNCNNLSTSVWIYDIDNYCIHWANAAALKLWEASSLQELQARDFKPESSDAVQKTLLDYRKTFEDNGSVSMYWQFTPKNIAKEAFCQMSGYTFEDGRIGILCEATAASLITNNLTQNSIIMLSTYDLNGDFISGNPPFIEQMGLEITHLDQIFPDGNDPQAIIEKIKVNKHYSEDCLLTTVYGKEWFNLQASLSNEAFEANEILVQQFNINERKLEQLKLTVQVNTDPLTGLLNRRGLKEQLDKKIREDTEFFIFYIDLDSFKMINDSMGHAVGDLVLKTLSKRLISGFFKHSIACRFGGDEFILVVKKEGNNQSQGRIANKLLKLTNQPYTDTEGNPILVSASVGSAHFPRDGSDLNKLLLRADAAMYMAKSQGKKRGVRYIKGMEDSLQRSSLIARYLYLAIENDEFELCYQPIFDTSNNQIYSFEALLRWHNPVLGKVPTEETIQIAESIGIIVDVENWVINQAVKDLPKLRNLTASRALISINISGLHFIDPKLVQHLLNILAQYKLTPADLVIELTESTLLKDINDENNGAKRLSDVGINLSIDDFGTGFSSLAYLHQIPAKVVKIDGSFTARLIQSSATITSIHHLLKSLNLITLVEGVETQEQSELLQLIGINLQQGYALCHPQPLSYYIDQAQLRVQTSLLL